MTTEKYTKALNEAMKGKTIDKVTVMSRKEADRQGYTKRPFVIHFTDGSVLYPQADDEGNDSGTMWLMDGLDSDLGIFMHSN